MLSNEQDSLIAIRAEARTTGMWRRVSTADLLLMLAVAAGALAFLSGFIVFARAATRPPVNAHGPADGIVVLTGGGARLAEAGQLMRAGYGRRLLISGANPKVRRDDLERLTGLDGAKFRCCVDVGYAALDTIGNADEAAVWAKDHNFNHLIVVTASYHMPRSLAELRNVAPRLKLSAHSVLPRDLAGDAWWRDASSLRVLGGEYVKYVSASARLALARLVAAGNGAVADNDRSKAMAGR